MLIEILVSLAIFSIVMTTSVGAILAILSANAKSQSTKSVVDNLSVAVENMTRSIRIGSDYKCISGHSSVITDQTTCPDGAKGISFLPQDQTINDATHRVEYFFDSSGTGAIYRYQPAGDTNAAALQLTAPEVNLTAVKFYLYGSGNADGQSRLFISINGQSGSPGKRPTSFMLQSSVTQRKAGDVAVAPPPSGGGSGGTPPTPGLHMGLYNLDFNNGMHTHFNVTCFDSTSPSCPGGYNYTGSGAYDYSSGVTDAAGP